MPATSAAANSTRHTLLSRLPSAIEQLPLTRARGFASLFMSLAEAPAQAPQLYAPQFQFSQHDSDSMRAGYGVAAQWRAAGVDRLTRLRQAARALQADWHCVDMDATGLTGFAMLGFAASATATEAASSLPNALLWLPEVGLQCQGEQCGLVLTTALPASPQTVLKRWTAWLERLLPALSGSPARPLPRTELQRAAPRPDLQDWERLVKAALTEIAAARLQKVVLSRQLRLAGQRRLAVAPLLTQLTRSFPSCQVISIQRDQRYFVAATPERLLAQQGNRLEVDAIAGTVARAAQASQDVALSDALRSSRKDLHEHRLVIDAVRTALQDYAEHIEVPAQPNIMQLNNAQHLWSPIQAELRPGIDVFQLAELLHPTPATNGEPRQAASQWLREMEPFERGWFTGAAGIVQPDLTGELWVLLRCAELQGQTADLFAGAGIVPGSDPQAEWRETEDKLAAMATALQYA